MTTVQTGSGGGVEIDAGLVDTLVAYLHDRGPGDTSFWLELAFMERELDDVSPHRDYIARTLNFVLSPVYRPEGLSEDELRAIVLALRQRARLDNAQRPLTPAEQVEWRFESPTFPPSKRAAKGGELITESITPTPEQERQATAYLEDNYPDIVRYWKSVSKYNYSLTTDEYYEVGVAGLFFWQRFHEAFDQVRPISVNQSWDTLSLRDSAHKIGLS